MMQGYVIYWEGYDENGFPIRNGNYGTDVEYSEHVAAQEFILGVMEQILTDAQLANPRVTRILIKGIFKL